MLFGLRILTDWPVARVASAPGLFDLEIRRTSVLPRPSAGASQHRLVPGHPYAFAAEPDGSAVVSWDDLFAFTVSADGTRIEGCGTANASDTALKTYLYSSVLSFALVRRGIEPFHATTIAGPDGALALLAPSGTGKSTLAAALIGRGARLLSDDVMVVEIAAGVARVHAGLPRLKLFPDAAHRFLAGSPGAQIHPDVDKRLHSVRLDQFAAAPAPLRACYVLESGDRKDVAFSRLTGRDAVLALAANTFNTLDTRSTRLRQHFDACVRLASIVPVFELHAPRGLDGLPSIADDLLHHAGALTPRSAFTASLT